MNIRQAEENDIPVILELLSQMDGEVLKFDEKASSVWEKFSQYPYYKVFLAEEVGIAVGCFSLIILDNLGHHYSKLAIVESVLVSEKCRGKGIGGKMMEYAMEKAKEEKCYKLMLSSNKKRTEAHEFYEKHGFTQHGISFVVEF